MDVSPACRNDAERRPEAEHRTAKVMCLVCGVCVRRFCWAVRGDIELG